MNPRDTRYMALALALGRRGQGATWPNPAVGCIIVNSGRIVGRGWTQPGGRPHAETVALAQAAGLARGADVYVSLEPCAHVGETPPCAKALVDAGVSRVFAAIEDVDGRVAGRGISMLRDAGVKVTTGLLAQEAAIDHAGFILRSTLDRPFITLKLASSFDGRIATQTGESKWITGPVARRVVHAMRARHDAVLIGAGTARADDPSLTVRDLGIARQPVRVVVSRHIDIPLMGQLAQSAKDIPLWLCHGTDADPNLISAWQGLGAKLLSCEHQGVQLNPKDVLRQLAASGVTRVFCEGGSGLAASLLRADLVDELVGFSAGLVIGADGISTIGTMGLENLHGAPRFTLVETRAVGRDILHRWKRGID